MTRAAPVLDSHRGLMLLLDKPGAHLRVSTRESAQVVYLSDENPLGLLTRPDVFLACLLRGYFELTAAEWPPNQGGETVWLPFRYAIGPTGRELLGE